MEDPLPDTDSSPQDIAKVITTRGRQIDIRKYIRNHPDELVKGVLIAGSIGSGKTQRAMQVIQAALEVDYGVVIFDPSGDHKRLISVYEDTVVLDYREFIMNPLEPPTGMGMDEWAPTFIQVFAQNYGLKDPSIAILQKGMNELISATYSKEDIPPTLEELLQEVRQYRPRERSSEVSSHVSVQNRLESLLDSEIGNSVNVKRGFQPEEFESGLLVIQLPSSGITRAHELLVGITIAKLFAYRAWRKMHSDEKDSKILIVLEEAHNYLSEARRADRRGERSQLERALIEGRKLDIGFLIIDQLPQRISSHVLGSCNMWIVGKLIDPEAKKVIGEALCLDAVWSRDGLISLPTGGAFIRVEHMHELEKQSPLKHWSAASEEQLWGAQGLPALVAVPSNEETLVPDIPHSLVKNQMCTNRRYMMYFKRYASQYIEKSREILPDYAIQFLERFITRIDRLPINKNQSFFDYSGLTSDDIESLRVGEQKEQFTSPPMSLRSRIHDLEVRCRILSSDVNQSILATLYSNSPQGIPEFVVLTKKSKSWLSRILTELQSRGYIKKQHEESKFILTAHGHELLHWARIIVSMWNFDDEGGGSNITQLAKKDFEWLLNQCADELEIRENAHLAGWMGAQEVREDLRNLIFRAQTLAGIKGPEIALETSDLDSHIFKNLLSSLESNVTRILLSAKKNIPLAGLPTLCNLSDRSSRRHLGILEKQSIVERQRGSTGWSVSISDSWSNLLLDDCEPAKKQIRMTTKILNDMVRHVIDNAALEMFTENHKNSEVVDYIILKILELKSYS